MAAIRNGCARHAWALAFSVMLAVLATAASADVGAPCSGGEANIELATQTLGAADSTTCTGISTATVGPTLVLLDGSTTTILSPSITVIEEIDVHQGATLVLGNLDIVPIRKTGQTNCWDSAGASQTCAGTGQDGELEKGVPWPVPRFTNNDNGTVTDNLTELVWMQAPECGTEFDYPDTLWSSALDAANAMAAPQCGLSDGSSAGDWRIPNVNELASLFHFGYAGIAVPNAAGTGQWAEGDPFSELHDTLGGAPNTYWGSTAYSNRTDLVWCSSLYEGRVDFFGNGATSYEYVWMVKGKTSGSAPAPVPATGQTTSIHAGDDGALKKGISWPSPRFTDNNNGTVTDNLTGLVWLKDAGCFSPTNWAGALSSVDSLEDKPIGFQDCGLSDGSSPGDWRLPNLLELRSVVHHAYNNRAVPDTAGVGQWQEGDPFSDVRETSYWTSTTNANRTDNAWNIPFKYGNMVSYLKTSSLNTWPVRDPQ